MKTEFYKHTIEFGERKIPFNLHLNGRTQLKIMVTPELTVEVFAPLSATDEQILVLVQKKASWIAQKLDKQAAYHPLPVPRQYINGETLVYLGRQYLLKVETGVRQSAKLIGRHLKVWVEDISNRREVKQAVEGWYKEKSRQVIDRYLEKCQAITHRHEVPEPQIMIRNMKRRWGSCSPASRITLNLKLVQVPVHCIEYVIMHELCHMKYHNHSKAFYSLLTRCLPDWRKRKADLDRFRLS